MAPIKSSLARTATKLLGVFRDRDRSLRGLSQTSRETFLITGGTKTSYTGYTVHTFLSSGTLKVIGAPSTFTCDILVVGGGGAGGSGVTGAYEAGGGGAGGMRTFPNQPVGSGTFAVTVGDGGTASPDYTNALGNYSEVAFPSPLRSEGGGAGGQHDQVGSSFGGSGGGCIRNGSPGGENRVAGPGTQGGSAPSSVPSQGNQGGNGLNSSSSSAGGGGGGAGGAGGTFKGPNNGGDGGAGLQNDYRTGSNQFYAGGGGGAGCSQTTGPVGGSSIGGDGCSSGTAGATNTGSGGGGGAGGSSPGVGGDGGPGIVVLRYSD